MATKALKPRKPTPRATLTDKQEAWCRWMVAAEVAGNGTEAARRAGYKGNDAALARIAYENRRKPKVIDRLEELEAKALSGADVTIEKVLKDLEIQRAQALEGGQYAAAVRCSELQGKYLKMFTERIEHVQTIEDVETQELVRLMREIAEAGGIDLARLIATDGPDGGGLSDTPGAQTTH